MWDFLTDPRLLFFVGCLLAAAGAWQASNRNPPARKDYPRGPDDMFWQS